MVICLRVWVEGFRGVGFLEGGVLGFGVQRFWCLVLGGLRDFRLSVYGFGVLEGLGGC